MALQNASEKVHVIFGNGPVGSAAARYLLEKGFQVRMASRSGRRPLVLFDDLPAEAVARLQFVAPDATNAEDTLRAARCVRRSCSRYRRTCTCTPGVFPS